MSRSTRPRGACSPTTTSTSPVASSSWRLVGDDHHAAISRLRVAGISRPTAVDRGRAEPDHHAGDPRVGQHDRFGSVELGTRVAAALPDARLGTLDAGHIPFFDDPARCAELIHDLAAGQPQADSLRDRSGRSGVPERSQNGGAADPIGRSADLAQQETVRTSPTPNSRRSPSPVSTESRPEVITTSAFAGDGWNCHPDASLGSSRKMAAVVARSSEMSNGGTPSAITPWRLGVVGTPDGRRPHDRSYPRVDARVVDRIRHGALPSPRAGRRRSSVCAPHAPVVQVRRQRATTRAHARFRPPTFGRAGGRRDRQQHGR